jgi:hypothetical protein
MNSTYSVKQVKSMIDIELALKLCLSKKHSPAATHNPWSIQQKRTLIYTYWSKFRWRVAVNCHWIKTYIRQKEDGCSKQNNNTMINMVGLSLDRFMVFPWPTAPARAFLLECLKKSQSGYDAQWTDNICSFSSSTSYGWRWAHNMLFLIVCLEELFRVEFVPCFLFNECRKEN